ncbi:hypothetical protein Droror1_Dr00011034 [Drosera rotundifolia]
MYNHTSRLLQLYTSQFMLRNVSEREFEHNSNTNCDISSTEAAPMSSSSSLLGDDGGGYDLARHLESLNIWRQWLGDSLYSVFLPSLSSSTSWDSFMRSSSNDESKSISHLRLQLRVRALLFDKAAVPLFIRTSGGGVVSKINPSYLQLHGDDVYFTFEDGAAQRDSSGKGSVRGPHEFGARNSDYEIDDVSQMFRQVDFPDTWYNQFIEQYRANRSYMVTSGDGDSGKRTPSEMSNYMRLLERQKRRRITFKEDQYARFANSMNEHSMSMQSGSALDKDSSADDSAYMFPETMFAMNCVPDSALPPKFAIEEKPKVEFFGVLDALPRVPQVATKNSIMIERLGIRPPEYVGMDQGPSPYRRRVQLDGKSRQLSEEQAVQLSKKVIVRFLATLGFEGVTEVPLEVLSQILSCHISKLGKTLKILADSYKKQGSAMELLRMFLHTLGYSNLASLVEQVKVGRKPVQQNTQQMQAVQSQLLLQQQNSLQLPQQNVQIPRQMHPQMQQMGLNLAQNLTFQQQQMLMRRRQAPSPLPVMTMDKDRPFTEVKLENPPDLPTDGNTLNMAHIRNPQFQLRQQQQQQQLAAFQRLRAQSAGQFRQLPPTQIPQMPTTSNSGVTRAPPVKVEGFEQLMGGDTSSKLDSNDTNKLTPPSK